MSYLGQIPQSNFVTKQSQTFTPDGSTTSFSLNFSVSSGVDIMLVINNVIQESGAGKAFTATGTTLTMSAAPASVDSMYCIFLGLALQTINPGANSVGVSQISDDAVTTGKIIDGAVTSAKINSSVVLGIAEADQWRLTTSFTGDANPIASNWERTDTSGWGNIGTGMTESSGIFTFPSTGVYLVSFNFYGSATVAQLYATASIEVTTNNSSYAPASYADTQFYGGTSYNSSMSQYFVDVTDVANVKVRFVIDAVGTSTTTIGSSTNTGTGVTFIRLGAT